MNDALDPVQCSVAPLCSRGAMQCDTPFDLVCPHRGRWLVREWPVVALHQRELVGHSFSVVEQPAVVEPILLREVRAVVRDQPRVAVLARLLARGADAPALARGSIKYC